MMPVYNIVLLYEIHIYDLHQILYSTVSSYLYLEHQEKSFYYYTFFIFIIIKSSYFRLIEIYNEINFRNNNK